MPKIRKLLQFLQIRCAFYGGSGGGGGSTVPMGFYVIDAVVAVAKNPIYNIYNNWWMLSCDGLKSSQVKDLPLRQFG